MRIGILTDIHGDIESMHRVLDRLERLNVDRLICLGDLVVHGSDHNAVVDYFRQRPDIPVLKGNHDIGATVADAELAALRFFSEASHANTLAAREALSEANKQYLAGLPINLIDDHAAYTHAAWDNPFALLRHAPVIAETFEHMPRPVLFAGHTHRTRVHHWPAGKGVWCSDSPAESGTRELELKPGDRYIINVGCTAQLLYDYFPPMCAVFEPEDRMVRFFELPDLRK